MDSSAVPNTAAFPVLQLIINQYSFINGMTKCNPTALKQEHPQTVGFGKTQCDQNVKADD